MDPEYKDFVAKLPSCLPSDTLYVKVDKDAVRKSGMKIENDSIPDRMVIDLKGRSQVYKNFMMMLEMIGQSNFSRPLYMSTTVGPDNYGNLYKHFLQEGIAWRFTPFTYAENQAQRTVVDTEKMYDNMMNKYKYGNLSQKGLYIDETVMRMCYTHRRWFALLIKSLVEEGKNEKALKALQKCEKEIPEYNVPHEAFSGSMEMAKAYFDLGKVKEGEHIMSALVKRSTEYVEWYLSLSDSRFKRYANDANTEIYVMSNFLDIYAEKLADSTYCEKLPAAELKLLQENSDNLNKGVQTLYNRVLKRCEDNQISFLELQYPSQGMMRMVEAYLTHGNISEANLNSQVLMGWANRNLDVLLTASDDQFVELCRKGVLDNEFYVYQNLASMYKSAEDGELRDGAYSSDEQDGIAQGKAQIEENFDKRYGLYYNRLNKTSADPS